MEKMRHLWGIEEQASDIRSRDDVRGAGDGTPWLLQYCTARVHLNGLAGSCGVTHPINGVPF